MGHQLTIKGAEAIALAEELAALTGQGIEDAVTDAVRCRIASERRLQDRVDRVMAIAAEIRSRSRVPLPSTNMAEFYDERGLPQ